MDVYIVIGNQQHNVIKDNKLLEDKTMRELIANDIFQLPTHRDGTEGLCVTTNGMIKKNGHAVMGRGIALQANNLYHVSGKLATHLAAHGNVAANLGVYDGIHVLSFPTKNDWRDDSDINLIKRSAEQLMKIADDLNLTTIYLPKPGCANGHLDWNDVKPVISEILDDRFIVVIQP